MNKFFALMLTLVVCLAIPAISFADVKGDASGFTREDGDEEGYPVKGPWNIEANPQVIKDMRSRQTSVITYYKPVNQCMSITNKLQQNNCLARVIGDLKNEISRTADDAIATCKRMVVGSRSCKQDLKGAKQTTMSYLAEMSAPYAFEDTEFEQLHVVGMFISSLMHWQQINAAMKLN